jgi:hypothetical protein
MKWKHEKEMKNTFMESLFLCQNSLTKLKEYYNFIDCININNLENLFELAWEKIGNQHEFYIGSFTEYQIIAPTAKLYLVYLTTDFDFDYKFIAHISIRYSLD